MQRRDVGWGTSVLEAARDLVRDVEFVQQAMRGEEREGAAAQDNSLLDTDCILKGKAALMFEITLEKEHL